MKRTTSFDGIYPAPFAQLAERGASNAEVAAEPLMA